MSNYNLKPNKFREISSDIVAACKENSKGKAKQEIITNVLRKRAGFQSMQSFDKHIEKNNTTQNSNINLLKLLKELPLENKSEIYVFVRANSATGNIRHVDAVNSQIFKTYEKEDLGYTQAISLRANDFENHDFIKLFPELFKENKKRDNDQLMENFKSNPAFDNLLEIMKKDNDFPSLDAQNSNDDEEDPEISSMLTLEALIDLLEVTVNPNIPNVHYCFRTCEGGLGKLIKNVEISDYSTFGIKETCVILSI